MADRCPWILWIFRQNDDPDEPNVFYRVDLNVEQATHKRLEEGNRRSWAMMIVGAEEIIRRAEVAE